jgi:serine/threonine-protein kinase
VTLGAVVAVVTYAELHGRGRLTAPTRRSVLALPLTQPVSDAPGLTFALSPDGTSFVYVGRSATSQELFVRGMETMDATPLPGTEGASTPFFSPDGQWVGFLAGGKIRKVPLRGGPVETVCAAPGAVLGASWGEDGIVFAPSTLSGLMRVPAGGGTPVALTTPDTARGETGHRWPQVLAGGTGVLFTSWSGGFQSARAEVLDLRTHVIHHLGAGIGARYSSTGHIIFATPNGRLLARRFDRQTLQASEATSEVLSGVRLDGGPAFAVGPGGMIIYMPAETAERTVDWVDRAGRFTVAIGARRVYSDPRLSPDDSRLALTIRQEGAADVWVYSFAAGTLQRLTRGAESLYPVWAPDGRSIAFASSRRGTIDLYRVDADGSAEPTLLWAGPGDEVPDSWSPDGKTLYFRTTDPATARDVWALRMGGPKVQVEMVLRTEADERSAMISPDGRWLAFTSDVSGADQVYVRPSRGTAARWQVSVDGGTEPLWSRDGRELFYRAGDGVMAAAVETRGGFRVASRAQLFSARFTSNPFRTNYDVARDGRRFLVIPFGEVTAQLVALMNWLPSGGRAP